MGFQKSAGPIAHHICFRALLVWSRCQSQLNALNSGASGQRSANSTSTPGRVNQISQITSTALQPHRWCMGQCGKSIQISYDHDHHFLRIRCIHGSGRWEDVSLWQRRPWLVMSTSPVFEWMQDPNILCNSPETMRTRIADLLLLELDFPLILSHWATSEPPGTASNFSPKTIQNSKHIGTIRNVEFGVQTSAKGNDFEWYTATI